MVVRSGDEREYGMGVQVAADAAVEVPLDPGSSDADL
jgi:hypothetical protein